jgi:hypothetical protein
MPDLHPEYHVDEQGNRIVKLPEEEYEVLLALAQGSPIRTSTLEKA